MTMRHTRGDATVAAFYIFGGAARGIPPGAAIDTLVAEAET